MQMQNGQFEECIDKCFECATHCEEVLFEHCLEKGGKHVEQNHVKLMSDCIEICRLAASFMTRNSSLHNEICNICARVCSDCADSCEEIGGEVMENCARICRDCADSCTKMGRMKKAA